MRMQEAGVPVETIRDDVDLRMYLEMLEREEEMYGKRSESDS